MKSLKLLLVLFVFVFTNAIVAQSEPTSELANITSTLNDYIEGSTNGQPQRLKKAFHKDLNLYSVRDDKLQLWSGVEYIKDTKEGVPTGEAGKIISIDFENNIAVAKVQISHPKSTTPYVDYFMLVKYEGSWKIIHKMYTKRVN